VQPSFPKCSFQSQSSVKLIGLARHKFAAIALTAFALCSTFWALLDILGAVSHNQIFGVAAFESRFDGLRKTIQPHSVYGYLSDSAPTDPSSRLEFYLTEYTLAPAIVKAGNEREIIVNFHNNRIDNKVLRANRLVLVQDFGNGVVLCRSIQP
jgi:hypothetical protein